MHCHQVLTGACNIGDRTFAVGRVEGVPFTAYAAGCNVVILASNFERVQVIPGLCHNNIQISCIDCSTDTGKIAAAYGKSVCIFEPSPIAPCNSRHHLDYAWVQTGVVEAESSINNVSWNLEGTRLLSAGDSLQMWSPRGARQHPDETAMPVMFDLGGEQSDLDESGDDSNIGCWDCIWKITTSQPTQLMSFSPDGCLFATCGSNDRLIKLWYDDSHILGQSRSSHDGSPDTAISYSYVYLPHPAAVTGFTWRTTSKYMPKGSVSNMVVSSCKDNICRVWVETVLPDDGLIPMHQLDPVAAQNPRFRTHRHKHKFVSRLKHIKACFGLRRQTRFPIGISASGFNSSKLTSGQSMSPTKTGCDPIVPTMPSTYSVHDFPSYGYHAMGVTPGFHFHLAASINAATDIPLVPSLSSSQPGGGTDDSEHNFVLHWLNNKEMHFTQEAENLLLEVSKKALEKDIPIHAMDADRHSDTKDGETTSSTKSNHRPSNTGVRGRSVEEDETARPPATNHNLMSAATSSTSIATDVTASNSALGDALDRRIEALLRNWLQSSDMLFSVHPVDGSLLLWILDFLDDYHGSFRQTQVSFCARIPNALPLGDAMTMSPHLALYSTPSVSFVQQLIKLEAAHELECRNYKAGIKYSGSRHATNSLLSATKDDAESQLPVVSMTTKHANGSLNLWHLTVEGGSKFTHVLNILHQRRVCGHRFQLNAVKCHPELPLLLTTSHHNVQKKQTDPHAAPTICVQDSNTGPWCSELLVWRVDGVGPLCRSGGLSELARLNSPHPTAFSTAAWIPALMPSSSLGNLCNSPSACFVASDGQRLRVYQTVLDGRALLAEMCVAERRNRRGMEDSLLSISTDDSSLREHPGHTNLGEVFTIVSEQSSARPGCVLQLSSLDESEPADPAGNTTLLLHVYHQGLVLGQQAASLSKDKSSSRASMAEEPFYVTQVLETSRGTEVQMWRLVLVTQQPVHDLTSSPDGTDENDDVFSQSRQAEEPKSEELPSSHPHLTDASPVISKTSKVCCQILPLPAGVTVVHAAPSAGHLSSACIYPACQAPFLLATACSDNKLRFWCCNVTGSGEAGTVEWVEWTMMSRSGESAIDLPGVPLHVSCAYSGRVAVAFLPFDRDSVVTSVPFNNANASKFSCKIAVYECESNGGSEWVMCEPVTVEDVVAMDAWQLEEQLLDQAHVTKIAHCRNTTTNLVSALSSDNIQSVGPFKGSPTSPKALATSMHMPVGPTTSLGPLDGASTDALRLVSNMLHVPSMSTLHSLRSQKYSKRGVEVKQREPVQVDWVSKEDGSFLLTVVIGSKIIVLTDVNEEMAAATMKTDTITGVGCTASPRAPVLKKSLSVHQITLPTKQKYMELTRAHLQTADNLAPLPMSVGWTREGLLVVGMDNEMHCYTQWTNPSSNGNSLLTSLQPKAALPAHLQPACSLLFDEKKRAGDVQFISPEPYTVGIMEASQLMFNVLPLYHPRQLHELLNSGKIRRVKAILAHLLRYLTQLNDDLGALGGSCSVVPSDAKASWSRSRTLSVNAPHSSGSREGRSSISLRPEDINNLKEVKTVPPMPLWQLLEADKESTAVALQENQEEAYAELFGGALPTVDDDDLKLDDDETDRGLRRTSVSHENRGLTYFGPRQTQYLAAMLTHTQLPGLSSLDQMHLLALSDTVASCNVDFADKFDISKAKEAMAKETYSRATTDEPSMESLDDCGLRFLLALRHHTYLLRCLPGQRSALQRSGIACHNIVWAFHSESQEELLQFLPSCRQNNPKWSELRELGVGWWVRNNTVLQKLILMVAKSAFQQRKDPLDAAIYYLAMKKKSLVWGLFRSIDDKRMTEFFASDFTQERWRLAALKNAYALMGKQRFEHAAAFFLLAGALKDAIEVVVAQLQDEQLAMVIIRLYEGELEAMPPALEKMLYTRVLGCDEDGTNEQVTHLHPDPFLRSMAYWLMRNYTASLQTLLNTDPTLAICHDSYDESKAKASTRLSSNISTADPTVFNFYIYLRTHPLLIRQCIANTAKDTGGGMMASCLTVGADHLDKKSSYESSITLQERCLYFTTAYAHLQAGCPVVALEVLSKLPATVQQSAPDGGDTTSLHVSETASQNRPSLGMINTGTLDGGLETAGAFDWSSGGGGFKDTSDELQLDFSLDVDDDEVENEPSAPKQEMDPGFKVNETRESTSVSSIPPRKTFDVMAQQLKFIACLKIMMSELGTLGSSFFSSTSSNDGITGDFGGQLRHDLHLWLEHEVAALKELSGYSPVLPESDILVSSFTAPSDPNATLGLSGEDQASTSLHDILQREKLQFENKLARAARRKRWLAANQQLLHTLLAYCSLHGCSGGGLTMVRLELLLLLQELQQDSAGRNMLLSPLPCPTTLPLLSAVVASNKTVVADPVKQLQNLGEDLLANVASVRAIGKHVGMPQMLGKVAVWRDLAIALSSSLHQALSDSEPSRSWIARPGESGSADEPLEVTTQPGKWPGVTSLLCLMTREKDEETPKLSLLLCEALVGVYICLLAYGLVTCDAAILYRLVSRKFSNREWAQIFGGGAKRPVKMSAAIPPSVLAGGGVEAVSPSSSPAGSDQFLTSTLSSLQKTRLKFNMKLLGQLGFQEVRSQTQDGESKPAFREQFVSPSTSIVSFLMTKPVLPSEDENIDYDSAGSDEEELYEEEEEEDDVFKEPKILAENKEHSDHRSYSWCLLRLACVKRAEAIIKNFFSVPQIDFPELAVQSPLLHGVLYTLHSWTKDLTAELEELQGPPPEYIPGCFAQSVQPGAPAISKYRGLRETHNTPFARGQKGVSVVVRLWQFLVRQDDVIEVFVRYIFARKRPVPEPVPQHSYAASEEALSDSGDGAGGGTDEGSEAGGGGGGSGGGGGAAGVGDHSEVEVPTPASLPALDPVRIIHKEQDNIAAFCINRVNSGLMSIATVKEVQELDISLLLQHPNWLCNTTELDLLAPTKEGETVNASNYLVVQCPADKDILDGTKDGGATAMVGSSSSLNAQTGRGASVIRSHKTEGARRMTAHPVLPVYLVGCQDGSVTVREWQHTGVVARPRPGGTFAKVTRLHFNQQGNKFGVMDSDGNLSLYHLGLGTQVTKPFYSHQCHNKHGSDFAFVGSSSLLATSGQSSDHRNVALWDTLMPPRKANVVSWLCHESGTAAMLYAPQNQILLSAGKKGTVCIFDVRQRTLRHRFQAHESAIKCLALDPSEEFFVSGAADGDIKVWGLTVHNLIYNLPGEHSRTSLFKNLSQGVTQLHLDAHNRLFSCGGDGSIKLRTFPERDLNLNLL
ncbi:dmX-like protein 2 isoform X2 [Hyalella azteca]|uniref:DmX-like protein 2 isoform X2 n=1 Tax=Hyalella azteca TaxID=294128 RepID=A0A8B7NWE2_HYAAZ|nr:dmX-like protein 2 isoform X2 [Hyalella azteca]